MLYAITCLRCCELWLPTPQPCLLFPFFLFLSFLHHYHKRLLSMSHLPLSRVIKNVAFLPQDHLWTPHKKASLLNSHTHLRALLSSLLGPLGPQSSRSQTFESAPSLKFQTCHLLISIIVPYTKKKTQINILLGWMSDSWIFVRQLSDKEPDITILITGLFHCNKPLSQNTVAGSSDSVTVCSGTKSMDLGCIPGFAISDRLFILCLLPQYGGHLLSLRHQLTCKSDTKLSPTFINSRIQFSLAYGNFLRVDEGNLHQQ